MNNAQAIADAHPRMTEPVSRKEPCSRCGRQVSDYEQDFATGDLLCELCLREDEESDDGQY